MQQVGRRHKTFDITWSINVALTTRTNQASIKSNNTYIYTDRSCSFEMFQKSYDPSNVKKGFVFEKLKFSLTTTTMMMMKWYNSPIQFFGLKILIHMMTHNTCTCYSFNRCRKTKVNM